jgi:RNA polymerase sigma-70 factor (ECF subfamily)
VRYPPGQRLDLPTSPSLLSRLRQHDADGWRTFLTLYTPLVVRWCRRQELDEHDTADVAQDVFHEVATYIRSFQKKSPSDSFRGWLCRITHHMIADFVRQRDRLTTQGGTEALQELNADAERPVVEPDEDECSAETLYLYEQAVKMAQGEFSERMWQMFWRTAVDGNPAPAVAQEFNATPAAVRQAKSRVVRRLKQLVCDVAD